MWLKYMNNKDMKHQNMKLQNMKLQNMKYENMILIKLQEKFKIYKMKKVGD